MDLVWARDPIEGFILSHITELLNDGVEVTPIDEKFKKRILAFSDVFKAQPNDEFVDNQKDYDDNCEMMYLNEATLLNNIRKRYYKNKIYSYVANILIAVNPYKDIPELYDKKIIKKYEKHSIGELSPHIYAIADKTLRDMKLYKKSQSIIVSGESGAGKTESTKHLLNYLCYQNDVINKQFINNIQTKILDTNPILESFGNAKTMRNNNSSRFGKFLQIHFNEKFQINGGHISHYLLEKSRLILSDLNERSYHIFYQLMIGCSDQLRHQLQLTNPDDFNYLKYGCTRYFQNKSKNQNVTNLQLSKQQQQNGSLNDLLLDDLLDFKQLDQLLKSIIDPDDCVKIYQIIAAILHLGNVEFVENSTNQNDGCKISTNTERSLKLVADLLDIDLNELRHALEFRVMQSTRGGIKGTVIMVPLKVYEAQNARDALAKALYSNLFDYIVLRVNQNIPFQSSSYYIGVLDIAGFEFFTVNSFEQFCINYCNEKLQQFFNEIILKSEQKLYKSEGLNIPEIKFLDNQDCINLIENKNHGILFLLDEESKLPKSSYQHFTDVLHKNWTNEYRLDLPRSSKLKLHRNLRDDEGFLIRHFAGAVCYQTRHFIDKNNDALHASLECILQESNNKLIKTLFAKTNLQKGKLTFISVGNKFKTQLSELMDKLRQNGTNFVRCIKPNTKMIDNEFDGPLSLMQLKCSGMISVLELMEYGYPSRTSFLDLYHMYFDYLPDELKQLQPKTFCEAMLHSLKLKDKDFKFGVTKVFFRPGKFAEFDQIMKSDPEHLKLIISDVKKFLIKSRWIKLIFCAITVIKLKNKINYRRKSLIILQKYIKGYLTRKHYSKRIKIIIKIRKIFQNLKQMEIIAQQLKQKKMEILNDINRLENEISKTIEEIKKNHQIKPDYLENLYKNLIQKVDTQMLHLEQMVKDQKNAEEQMRLKRIQDELEKEKKRKLDEEQRRREEEEMRKKRTEIEIRRKLEEEELKKQEELNKKSATIIKMEQEKAEMAEKEYQDRVEQERQDHELALRLAEESNGQLEESPPMIRKNETKELIKGKYDLTKWKYSELRDTINTSCDIELLEACRHEFHRRLKVYHAWKAKNRKRTFMNENERAPRSIMESAAAHSNANPTTTTTRYPIKTIHIDNNQQRYFRIPFVRPTNGGQQLQSDNQTRGWWYAHFDGQYVARQIELHPDKLPILLMAGKDDMQMCELSLEETGLTRKRGAEILENEFNKEWIKYGGQSYLRPADRKQS